jgi:predicted acyltransferase
MFTLEESALLGRMLRTTGVIVLCVVLAVLYWLVHVYAAPAANPTITRTAQHARFVPAHRHTRS